MNVLVTHAKITQPVLILSTSSVVTAYLVLMKRFVKTVRRIVSLHFISKSKIISKNRLKPSLYLLKRYFVNHYITGYTT